MNLQNLWHKIKLVPLNKKEVTEKEKSTKDEEKAMQPTLVAQENLARLFRS